jgi:hypothetical protein
MAEGLTCGAENLTVFIGIFGHIAKGLFLINYQTSCIDREVFFV